MATCHQLPVKRGDRQFSLVHQSDNILPANTHTNGLATEIQAFSSVASYRIDVMASNLAGPIYPRQCDRCLRSRYYCHRQQRCSLSQYYYYCCCLYNCCRWPRYRPSHCQRPSNHNRPDVPGLLIVPAMNNSQVIPSFMIETEKNGEIELENQKLCLFIFCSFSIRNGLSFENIIQSVFGSIFFSVYKYILVR